MAEISYIRDRNTGDVSDLADVTARQGAADAKADAAAAQAAAEAAQTTADGAVTLGGNALDAANTAQATGEQAQATGEQAQAAAEAAQDTADGAVAALATKYELGLGTEIPAGADLNDYTTPGKYFIKNAGTVTNYPDYLTGKGDMGFLTVEVAGSDKGDPVIIQKYHGTWAGRTTWVRMLFDNLSTWTGWECTSGIDAIVAEGSTDGWHWVKYASGFAEAEICKAYAAPSNLSGTSGPYKLPDHKIGFPFAFVGAAPKLQYTVEYNNQFVGWGAVNLVGKTDVALAELSTTSNVGGKWFYMHIKISGMWK